MPFVPAQPISKSDVSLAGGRFLECGPKGHLMGILNVTPDSFSDGGRYADIEQAVSSALRMVEEGASIIDIGGESTRPGADPVHGELERDRVLPVIEALAARSECLISIDTYRAQTARDAVRAGAHLINDVYGLMREPEIADVAAETGAGLCIMHTGREREPERRADVIEDQVFFLERALARARTAGVKDEQLMIDPGFGFAKDANENFALMARFDALGIFGRPILAGTSRKRFLGEVTGRDAADRDRATAATTALLRVAGASVLRVHDVAANRDALTIADAMLAARAGAGDAAA